MRSRVINGFAGFMILLGLSMGYFVNEGWFFLTAFVGVNLFQTSFTKWCLLDDILRKLKVEN
jgi:hypothetical protein